VNLSIIGTGLIGGSIGLAARKRGLAESVVGFDLDPAQVSKALSRGAISLTSANLQEAASEADIVFVATPVGAIPGVVGDISPDLPHGCVVSDVGSTKQRIVSEALGAAAGSIHFIGGHPIAGSEREGIDAAEADLFEGAYWILTPTSDTDASAYKTLVAFVSAIGAKVISLDPSRHDELMALTSHLPQMLASALMVFAATASDQKEGLPLITAGGFRDMTRIAASSSDLWLDILQDNREAILDVLAGFGSALGAAENYLREKNWDQLRLLLERASASRKALPGKPGVSPEQLVELTFPIPDRPGVLSEVTTAVGEAGVNIEDIDIVHSPEGGRGTLHLTVSGSSEAKLAQKALELKGYTARIIEQH